MALMETIKFVMFYSLQVAVVAPVGIALFAGLYQLIRDKARQSRAPAAA
jgi:hypothetical protein